MDGRYYGRNIFPVIIASLSIFAASYNIATISVGLASIESLFHLQGAEVTLLTSAILMGAIFGAILSGIFSDRFGRIGILTVDLITFVLAGIGSALSTDFIEIFIFRFMVGIGVGIDYVVVFAYLSEVELLSGRGSRSLTIVMFFANFGILMAYASGAILSPFYHSLAWRYVFLSGAVLSIIPILLRLRITDTDEWKLNHHRKIIYIVREFYSGKNRRDGVRFSIPWFLYQISDQSLTLFLPLLLFTIGGNSLFSSDLGSVEVKIFTIPASLMTIMIIGRVGRRFLQSLGFALRGLFLGIMGVLLIYGFQIPLYISVFLLGGAFFFGALGPDKTTVISPAESFKTRIRATGQGFSEMFGRIGGLTGVLIYGYLRYFQPGTGLIFLSITCLLGLISTIIFFGWRISPDRIIS